MGVVASLRPVVPFLRRALMAPALAMALAAPQAASGADGAPVVSGEVDVALVLAADVSLSMDSAELALQRNGYADALGSPEVAMAIAYGRHKRIAVTYFEWGSADKQVVVAPWTVIDGPEAAARLSEAIRTAPPNSLERTAIGSALIFAGHLFDETALVAERRVVDISGDGPNNMGASLVDARERLVARGVTVNGLPIMPKPGDWPATLPPLDVYYETCVIGGLGAFSLPAETIDTFSTALRTKLILEIAGLPQTEPKIMPAALAKPINCREFD